MFMCHKVLNGKKRDSYGLYFCQEPYVYVGQYVERFVAGELLDRCFKMTADLVWVEQFSPKIYFNKYDDHFEGRVYLWL